jgi:Leucine Rich Repeat (LRR) protein
MSRPPLLSRTRISTRPPRIHFTIRTLFILTAIVAFALSLYRWKIEAFIKHNRAVDVIEAAGGYIEQERRQPEGPAPSETHDTLPPNYGSDIWVSFFSQVPRPAFEALPDLVHLRSLHFDDQTITDSHMPRIAPLIGTVRLFLGRNDISDEGLRSLRRMDRLQRLDLNDTHVTDAGLEHLQALTCLEELCLRDTDVTGTGAAYLEKLTRLRELWLNGTKCTNTSIRGLARLQSLQVLSLSSTSVGDEGLQHLSNLHALRELRLESTPVTDAGLPHLDGLSNLERLDLLHTLVTEQGVTQLHEALPDSRILWDGGLRCRESQ